MELKTGADVLLARISSLGRRELGLQIGDSNFGTSICGKEMCLVGDFC